MRWVLKVLTRAAAISRLASSFFDDNRLIVSVILQAKMLNFCCFQLLKCDDVLPFFVT